MFSAKVRLGIALTVSIAANSVNVAAVSAQEGTFDVFTGNGFLQTCSGTLADENAFRLGICFGWLSGFVDRDRLAAGIETRRICQPAKSTNGQLMDVVLKYLRDHPSERHLPISILAYSALIEAFPC